MTTKLEYDSFAKFLVSLGVIFIVSPAFLVAFILQENEVLFVKEEALLTFTETAKSAIEKKQEWYTWILDNAIYIIGFVFGIGVVLLFWGCVMWYISQRKIDKKQELELKEVEDRVKKLTEEENNDKIQQEIMEIEKDELKENNHNSENYSVNQIQELQNDVRDKNRIIREFLVRRYKLVERVVAKKICMNLDDKYDTKVNVKIENTEYDAISKSKEDGKDYIFEIKYLFKGNAWHSEMWRSTVCKLHHQIENYKKIIGRDAIPVLIIVTLDDQIEKINKNVKYYIKDDDILVKILTESELDIDGEQS